MKLSKIIEKFEEWMGEFTYDFEINSIAHGEKYKYKINMTEFGPCPSSTYDIYADEDGNFFNEDDNLISFSRDVYDYDKDVIKWIDDFEEKWRIK